MSRLSRCAFSAAFVLSTIGFFACAQDGADLSGDGDGTSPGTDSGTVSDTSTTPVTDTGTGPAPTRDSSTTPPQDSGTAPPQDSSTGADTAAPPPPPPAPDGGGNPSVCDLSNPIGIAYYTYEFTQASNPSFCPCVKSTDCCYLSLTCLNRGF